MHPESIIPTGKIDGATINKVLVLISVTNETGSLLSDLGHIFDPYSVYLKHLNQFTALKQVTYKNETKLQTILFKLVAGRFISHNSKRFCILLF